MASEDNMRSVSYVLSRRMLIGSSMKHVRKSRARHNRIERVRVLERRKPRLSGQSVGGKLGLRQVRSGYQIAAQHLTLHDIRRASVIERLWRPRFKSG